MKNRLAYLGVFAALTGLYFIDVPLRGLLLAPGDGLYYYYPLMEAVADAYRSFSLPLWNPYVFSGFPLMAAMQPGALYPPNIVLPLLMPAPWAYNLNLMLHYALAGFFTFLYLRSLGLGELPSVLGGMVFGFLGFLPMRLIHASIVKSAAWLPAIVYMFERIRREPDIKNIAFGAAAIALQILAGHPQIFLYTYIVLFIFTAFHILQKGFERRSEFALAAGSALGLGFLFALPQLVATYELSSLGTRATTTYEFFSQLSFAPHMLVALLYPFFFGGGYGGGLWAPELGVTSMDGFVGTLPLFAAALAFWRLKGRDPNVRLWGLVALVAFALALGEFLGPLHKAMFRLPVYNFFRSPSRHWFEITFALAVLCAYGFSLLLDRVDEGGEEGDGGWFRKRAIIVLGTVIFISAFSLTALKGPLSEALSALYAKTPERMEAALSLGSPSIYVPLITMALYLLAVIFLKRFSSLKYAIVLLVFIEAVSLRTMYSPPPISYARDYHRGLFEFLKADPEGRAAFVSLKVPDSLLAINHGISAVDGYDPLMADGYATLLDMEMFGYSRNWRGLIENNSILSMLGTKYLVLDSSFEDVQELRGKKGPDGHFHPPLGKGLPRSAEYPPLYEKAFEHDGVIVYRNLNALKRAYPATSLKETASVGHLKTMLYTFQLDPTVEAALSADDLKEIGKRKFSPGTVVTAGSRAGRVTLGTDFPGEGFVVLADRYYPGWRAYVDGERTKIYRTNGVLRGVRVPPGRHEVVFAYVPVRIYAAFFISAASLALTVIIVIARRRR